MAARGHVLQVVQPEDGGVAEHVLHLCLGLRDRGWAVELAAGSGFRHAERLRAADVPVHVVPVRRSPGRGDLRVARALRALDRRRRYGIVHAHSSKAGALVRLALPGAQRLVYTPHCFAFLADFGRFQTVLYRAVEQLLVWRGTVVAVSGWEGDQASRRLAGLGGRLRVIENGVGPCGAVEPDRALVDWAGGRPLAGFVSVLRPEKDPLTAVRAGALLARDGAGVRMAIVGEGSLEAEVRAEIDRLDARESVRWFPFSGDPIPHIRALDLLVMCSHWESLPLGPLEAMSCGVPVVATDVGGMGEIVHHGRTGLLVPPHDPAALAAAVREALSDPERLAAMGEAGRNHVHGRFSLETTIERTVELYEELLERSSTLPS